MRNTTHKSTPARPWRRASTSISWRTWLTYPPYRIQVPLQHGLIFLKSFRGRGRQIRIRSFGLLWHAEKPNPNQYGKRLCHNGGHGPKKNESCSKIRKFRGHQQRHDGIEPETGGNAKWILPPAQAKDQDDRHRCNEDEHLHAPDRNF